MFLRKKGLSADLFTWILATIAGVFILVFFYRFATQHIGVSEDLTDRQTAEYLIDELDAFSTGESSTNYLRFRNKVDLTFQCGSVGFSDFVKDLDRLVFAPSELHDDEIAMWTEVWKFPFPIAPLYYLTTKRSRTILIYDDRSIDFLQYHSFPTTMGIQSVHIKSLKLDQLRQQANGLDSLHLIYLTPVRDANIILEAFPSLKPDILEVNLDQHTLRYHNYRIDSFYLGDEMLYGAFFAPEQFPCLQRKALEHLWRSAQLLEQRARLLQGKITDPACRELFFSLSTTYHGFIDVDDFEILYEQMERVDQYDALLQKQGCGGAY